MIRTALAVAALLAALPSFAAGDKAGCQDHPLLPTRMPVYFIQDCRSEEFGRFEFLPPKAKLAPEGRTTFITYRVEDRKAEPSVVAVVRNYEAAIVRAGGTILQQDPRRFVSGKIAKGGQVAFVQAEKGNGLIWLRIVEQQEMKQYVEADAAALGGDLASTGHAAVYGIYFDVDRAEVKPESRPALEQIAKLLAQDPKLKLRVVGHTDMTGAMDANMRLSQARAEAVVQALVSEHGVAAARLTGHGVGPLAPVASNDSDEGRAKNRRVELVKE
jgi:outer membrane protein OmpA-like peptidoglycan-associated protein